MSVSAWGAALRLARRDVLRNTGRSALIVALIGIPVLLIGVVDIGYRTYQLTPAERVTRQIGAADVGLQWTDGQRVQQGSGAWLGGVDVDGATGAGSPSTKAVASLLPRGSRVIEERIAPRSLLFHTRAGLGQARLIGLDYRDPIAAGLVTQRSGRAPRTAGQVAITTALAQATGLRIGDLLHAQHPTRTFTIVGTVTDTHNQQDQTLYSVPAAVPVRAAASVLNIGSVGLGGGLYWLASTPRPVTWNATVRDNQAGLLALSRSVYLHPSAAARAATSEFSGSPVTDTSAVATVSLVAGMALLEIVLLAGPAFAVGAKRRRRDLALVAAGGGSPRDVRRVVLAGGVVIGALAGVAGVLGAIVISRLGLPLLRPHVARLPGAFTVPPVQLVIIGGVGLLAALLASIVPARAAGRTDVVAALSGRPARATIRARVPVVALVLAGVGVLVAVLGAGAGGNDAALAILAGTVLLEIAIIVCTPTLLTLLARLGARLPLTARLALRDAGRNRSAATPAVAAVMASVVGATAILIGITSVEAQQRAQYTPSLPVLSAMVETHDAAAATAALRATLPVDAAATISRPQLTCRRVTGRCPLVNLSVKRSLPLLEIAGANAAEALFGTGADKGRTALRDGRVVVTRRSLLHDGRVALDVTHASVRAGKNLDAGRTTTHEVAATYVPDGGVTALAVVPPALAARLGVRAVPDFAVARLRRAPSDAEQQTALARLQRVSPSLSLLVETGYHDQYAALELALVLAAVAIAVLAAVIATGLANVDGRADLTTLAAVGATPRIRRTLSTARAGVIAGIGTVVGVAAGFLAPAAYVYGQSGEVTGLRMVIPWSSVLAIVVAVPLLAAAVAGVFTRGRLPVE